MANNIFPNFSFSQNNNLKQKLKFILYDLLLIKLHLLFFPKTIYLFFKICVLFH